jgi:hypothetical protein
MYQMSFEAEFSMTGWTTTSVILSALIFGLFLPHLHLALLSTVYSRQFRHGMKWPGLFPIDKWNCHIAAKSRLPRTNNALEGWHRRFNARFPRSNMPLSQFIVRLDFKSNERNDVKNRS